MIHKMSRKARTLSETAAVFCLLVVVDYLTGVQLGFFVFYFIPVALLAWKMGRAAAVAMSFVAAAAWLSIEVLTDQYESIQAFEVWNSIIRLTAFLIVGLAVSKIRMLMDEQRRVNAELSDALATIRELSGILPMCSVCHKIRDDREEWIPLEKYIHDHSEAQISHGMCPRCYKKFYGEPDGT